MAPIGGTTTSTATRPTPTIDGRAACRGHHRHRRRGRRAAAAPPPPSSALVFGRLRVRAAAAAVGPAGRLDRRPRPRRGRRRSSRPPPSGSTRVSSARSEKSSRLAALVALAPPTRSTGHAGHVVVLVGRRRLSPMRADRRRARTARQVVEVVVLVDSPARSTRSANGPSSAERPQRRSPARARRRAAARTRMSSRSSALHAAGTTGTAVGVREVEVVPVRGSGLRAGRARPGPVARRGRRDGGRRDGVGSTGGSSAAMIGPRRSGRVLGRWRLGRARSLGLVRALVARRAGAVGLVRRRSARRPSGARRSLGWAPTMRIRPDGRGSLGAPSSGRSSVFEQLLLLVGQAPRRSRPRARG